MIFYAKIFLILYTLFENSTTLIAIMHTQQSHNLLNCQNSKFFNIMQIYRKKYLRIGIENSILTTFWGPFESQ